MYLNVKNEEISNEELLNLFCVRYHYEKNPKVITRRRLKRYCH
ncbi:hypothetical protein BAPAT_2483 [Bacillus anthracis str. SVA11]|nr:conserved hypothetical protein [Bacillus anthracis str. CDC 684]AHK38637.1 hypothetical protein BAPAT_2483 [Bacillus anthracis str. SVA11]